MKRRDILKSLAVLPAAASVGAQEPVVPPKPTPAAVDETPKIQASVPDAVADTVTHFFSAEEFAALRRLSDLLMPAIGETPGALQARAPQFLDFLLSQSSPDRQKLYRGGLDKLNAESRHRYSKDFSDLDPARADAVLAPLHGAWTYGVPADPFARFLIAAKEDVMTATANSREWIAVASKRSRRANGMAMYWSPIEPLEA
ncbi:MAG: gluconate 2-dehydrogenase subunit 3 family protein [Acidobacteriota bacterium]|nr:gluconate 2-dehydrogenase subunit 3 family protein [Acidobacteriota bacterium]